MFHTPWQRAVSRPYAVLIGMLVVLLVVSQLLLGHTPAAAAAGSQSTKLGYFYIPPKDGTTVDQLASRASVLVLTQGNERYRSELRAAGYTGKVLQYIVSSETEGPGPYKNASAACDASYTPLRNQVTDQVGDFCRYVHPNETWFLHNGRGERLYATWGGKIWYHMNPASTGWRTFAAQRMAADLLGTSSSPGLGYDGIYLDNVELSWYKAQRQLPNSDGVVQEFGDEGAFQGAWVAYLKTLSERLRGGGQLWGNMISDTNSGTSWNSYLEHLDGALTEAFATGYHGLSVTAWKNNLAQVETALQLGKQVLLNANGTKGDTTRQTFGLASYLLVTDNQDAFFRYATSAYYHQFWQYANYDVALGAPKGTRYESGSTWRRDFACGYVVVNPGDRTAKIVSTACTTTPSATPTAAPSAPETLTVRGLSADQVVSGMIQVEAMSSATQPVSSIVFYLDGANIWREGTAPYYLNGDTKGVPNGYDTRSLSNGTHVLKVVATDVQGATATVMLPFTVQNGTVTPPVAPETLTVRGLSADQVVSGMIQVEAMSSATQPVSSIVFYLDGANIWREGTAPYYLNGDTKGVPNGYDTRSLSNGTHVLKVVATDVQGATATVMLPFTVQN